jgi:Zn-finger nucleic acid-binding protein
MNCPVCTIELKISDRQGVEIDYCPKCRGVWLDRGELDKILERANAMDDRRGGGDRGRDRDDRYDDDDDDDSGIFGGGGRRGSAPRDGEGRGEGRQSFWSNLFDFG